jgi:choline dehydrogenase-like flavoprotein
VRTTSQATDAALVGVAGIGAADAMGKATTLMYEQRTDEAQQQDEDESYDVAGEKAAALAGQELRQKQAAKTGNALRHPLARDAALVLDGLPIPVVTSGWDDNDRKVERAGVAEQKRILEAAGARARFAASDTAHLMSARRTGSDAAKASVDRNCATWDVPGSRVWDGSVFVALLRLASEPGDPGDRCGHRRPADRRWPTARDLGGSVTGTEEQPTTEERRDRSGRGMSTFRKTEHAS